MGFKKRAGITSNEVRPVPDIKKPLDNGGVSYIFYNDCYLTFGVDTFPFSFSF